MYTSTPTTLPARPAPAVVAVDTGRHLSRALFVAFTVSALYTTYTTVVGLADPGFTATTPGVWLFYAVGFTAAFLARRPDRRALYFIAGLTSLLLVIAVSVYPTMFTPDRQTPFGWFENDTYVALLSLSLYLSVQRLRVIGRRSTPAPGTIPVEVADMPMDPAPGRSIVSKSHGTATTRPNIQEMYVVHRVFRREFTAMPGLVRRVTDGDVRRAAVVAGHADLIIGGLHMHHTGEDEVLWPLLLERAAPSTGLVETMQEQHERVDGHTERIAPLLAEWVRSPSPPRGERLALALEDFTGSLFEHLDLEEREILPLIARYISAAEWNQLGEHGRDALTIRQMPVLFGALLEEADDTERTMMLAPLPGPLRLFLRTLGARKYRRYISRVRNG